MRKTGGLNDTVFDVDDDKERAAASGMETNGYSFEGTDTGAMDYGLNRYPSLQAALALTPLLRLLPTSHPSRLPSTPLVAPKIRFEVTLLSSQTSGGWGLTE